MKIITFLNGENNPRLGLLVGEAVYDMQVSGRRYNLDLPDAMSVFLQGGAEAMADARRLHDAAVAGEIGTPFTRDAVRLLSPVPHPPSCRDAYAFRQHVATARRNRGLEMTPEFDRFPVFYFTNHNAVVGEGDVTLEADHFRQLDFELECAAVIGAGGKNIPASQADRHIAGFCIMNDLSARQLQMEEMKLSLGPAKGKDFATALGPWLVTPDELAAQAAAGSAGLRYDLRMRAFHNGECISDGNLKDMNWTFAQIIERVSYGVEIYPGDVIGSGTVGTGCYLELNGTRQREAEARGESYTPVWLQPGDTIELEIDGLGRLANRVLLSETHHSILEPQHNA